MIGTVTIVTGRLAAETILYQHGKTRVETSGRQESAERTQRKPESNFLVTNEITSDGFDFLLENEPNPRTEPGFHHLEERPAGPLAGPDDGRVAGVAGMLRRRPW